MERSNKKTIRIGIHQPGYHRYCGYFYKMLKSDLFISLDTVQYVPREWQNRQIFCDGSGSKWLSVPVNRGRDPIKDKKIVDANVIKNHWEYIKYIYRKSPFFDDYCGSLENIYLHKKWEYLNDLCDALILLAKDILGIKTKYVRDSENGERSTNTRKASALIDSIKRSKDVADYDEVIYLPRNYPIPEDFYLNQRFDGGDIAEIDKFAQAGIRVQTYDFCHPVYRQFQYPKGTQFIPNLSVYDLIFNCGNNSRMILESGGNHEYRD